MLMTDPAQAKRGLALCQEAPAAGDADAQLGGGQCLNQRARPASAILAAARMWYEMAAKA